MLVLEQVPNIGQDVVVNGFHRDLDQFFEDFLGETVNFKGRQRWGGRGGGGHEGGGRGGGGGGRGGGGGGRSGGSRGGGRW